MMATFVTEELSGTDPYKLLTGLIVPRPIGWIGSRSASGSDNLAPYSFFNAISGDPPMVMFSPGAGRKDTRDNVVATGVFTLNVVTVDLVTAMNESAASIPDGNSEFDHAGLTAVDATLVDAPMVAECPATMECRMTQHFHVGRPDGGNTVIIGEVVAFHIDDRLLDGTRVDQAALGAVGRHVGELYSTTETLFGLPRPD